MNGLQKVMAGLLVTAMLALVGVSDNAEARPGSSGRSFGSRGSRGFSPRYSQPNPGYRSNPQPPPSYNPNYAGGSQRGSFLRSMAGGLAGGFLGAMLFRNLGWAAPGGGIAGGGGIGLLEILALAAVAFFAFRWFRSRKQNEHARMANAHYQSEANYSTPAYAAPEIEAAPGLSTSENPSEILRRYDGQFDLAAFQKKRVEDFFRLQSAYGRRSLDSVRDFLTPELYSQLDQETSRLRAESKINRVENVSVNEAEILEAWQDPGREYATMRVNASALDYTVDEKTGSVVQGSRETPVEFEEYWTFARDIGFAATDKQWKLAAIENRNYPA